MVQTIKFSSDYHKLPKSSGDKRATLLFTKIIDLESQTKWFLDYDTTQRDGQKYQLPKKGRYIFLLFESETGAIFSTLRRNTDRKWEWYQKQVGKEFIIFVGNSRVALDNGG